MFVFRHSAFAFVPRARQIGFCTGLVVVLSFVAGCGGGSDSSGTSGRGQSAKADAPFSGTFSGTLAGTPVKLTIEQNGDQLTGRMSSSTEYSALKATASGDSAKGRMQDPDGTGGDVEFARDGDGLNMSLTLADAASGASQTLQVPLKRLTVAAGAGNSGGSVVRDPTLVGRWRYTEAGGSDGFTYAIDTWMIVREDGTYRYGDSKMGAGDASFSSISEGNDAQVRQWRTEDQVMYVRDNDASEWAPFAKYFAEADRMMLTYNNGKKQVWERQ